VTPWIDPELDDAIYAALREVVGRELAFEAAEAVVLVLLSRRDAFADMHVMGSALVDHWTIQLAPLRTIEERDWPFPPKPPYPADDEGQP
jgi:hypothetical protein